MKKQNGITLIALVITIIVLLILAGITITAILGDNGILGKSEKAKLKTEQAAILEELRLKAYDKKTEDINNEMLNIDYLKDTGYIKEEFTQAENTCYAINPNRLNPVPVTGKGTVDDGDIYYLLNGTLYYKQTNDEDTEIGPVFRDNYTVADPSSPVNWTYEETPDGDIEITGFDIGTTEEWVGTYMLNSKCALVPCPILYIPSKINGKTVKKVSFVDIPNIEHYGRRLTVRGIEEIVYPDTVIEIGKSDLRFEDVTEVHLSNNLVKIGTSSLVFPWLTYLNVPETVKIIEDSAFGYCTRIKEINLPETIDYIGKDVFSFCYALESIVIPEGVTEIADETFKWCHSLKSVTIPEGVTRIGAYAFDECPLSEITLPSTLKEIDEYAFKSCRRLTKVIIPEGVTIIKDNAFKYCDNLSEVSLPSTLKEIGEYAFGSCDLNKIVIPANVTKIGNYAFRYCNNLSEVEYLGDRNDITFGIGCFEKSS